MEAPAEAPAPPAPFEPPAWVRDELGGATGKGIRIAVIDSGWDRTCPDPRVLPGVGLVDPADDLAMLRTDDDHDRVGHGTACINQILRIAPDARVHPVRVFGGDLETSPGTLQAGILWAIEQGVQVINLSLGTTLEGTLHPLYAACERARRQGIVVVAAGHNSRSWSYPAIFENVIGVSAERFESPYEYRYLPDEAMECQAWGVEQPVVWLRGEQVVKHGTSFAAPNIAGIVALFLERYPGATLEQVRELLRKHALSVIPADVSSQDLLVPRAGFSLDQVPRLAEGYLERSSPREREIERRIEAEIAPRIRGAGFVTRPDFLVLTHWKSPRSKKRCETNAESYVEETTRLAFAARDERLRIGILRLLEGVEWATASVLLHFGARDRYPIFDFRALWSLGFDTPPACSFPLWWRYTLTCRQLASRAGVSMRDLDRALWEFARQNQPRGPAPAK